MATTVLAAQAKALGIDLTTQRTSWAAYTGTFVKELARLRGHNATACVFGDIDIDDHRRWCQDDACQSPGLRPEHPLWQGSRRRLLNELLARGWRATIVVVRADALRSVSAGAAARPDVIVELEAAGIDPCGEFGEYHTVVTDGPRFAAPVRLVPPPDPVDPTWPRLHRVSIRTRAAKFRGRLPFRQKGAMCAATATQADGNPSWAFAQPMTCSYQAHTFSASLLVWRA